MQLLPQEAPGLAFFFDPQLFELTRANPFSPQSIKARCQIPRFWWSYGGPESGTKTDVVSRGALVKIIRNSTLLVREGHRVNMGLARG